MDRQAIQWQRVRGQLDEGFLTRYYSDCDGDSYGDASSAGALACTASSLSICAGHYPVADHTDCDDTTNTACNDANVAIYPGVAEVCNGMDDNGNGMTDEGLTLHVYYVDADGDGFGNLAMPFGTCYGAPPAGDSASSTDCWDSDLSAYPG